MARGSGIVTAATAQRETAAVAGAGRATVTADERKQSYDSLLGQPSGAVIDAQNAGEMCFRPKPKYGLLKLCRWGANCTHGHRCNFAHSRAELTEWLRQVGEATPGATLSVTGAIYFNSEIYTCTVHIYCFLIVYSQNSFAEEGIAVTHPNSPTVAATPTVPVQYTQWHHNLEEQPLSPEKRHHRQLASLALLR